MVFLQDRRPEEEKICLNWYTSYATVNFTVMKEMNFMAL